MWQLVIVSFVEYSSRDTLLHYCEQKVESTLPVAVAKYVIWYYYRYAYVVYVFVKVY